MKSLYIVTCINCEIFTVIGIFQTLRKSQKLSHAAQYRQIMEGFVDLENPNSILCDMNLRSIFSKETFAKLPVQYQEGLMKMLPECDVQESQASGQGYVRI